MSALVSSFRSKSWVGSITLMALFLGMLCAMALKGQQTVIIETGYGTRDVPMMISAVREAKSESKELRKQNEDLQKKLADYDTKAHGEGGSAKMSQDLSELRLWSGLVPATGPGVIVELRDSNKIRGMEGVIHDTDIRTVVNELTAAGAEAVSVNDQRFVAKSTIRCIGPVIRVNDVELAPPYVIKAIGALSTLDGALRMPGGVYDGFIDSNMIKITQSKEITVNGYGGNTEVKFAKPVPPGEKK